MLNRAALHLASIPARYALERRAWEETEELDPRPCAAMLDWDRFPWPEAVICFARGLGAAHLDQMDEAWHAYERLRALETAAQETGEETQSGRSDTSPGSMAIASKEARRYFGVVTRTLNQTSKTMTTFSVPNRADVAPANQASFDQLEKLLGFVPNLYATFAYSDTALVDYLAFQNRKSSLRTREREAINLVVSQVNECRYCQSAHTALGKLNGFTDEQILEIRSGSASFDPKLDALVAFVKDVAETRGHPSREAVEKFFAAGYGRGHLVDVLIVIGDKIISNYLHGVTQIPIDFPLAPELMPMEV